MWRFLIFSLILLIMQFACARTHQQKLSTCFYKIDSLARDYDTSKFTKKINEGEFQLVEPRSKDGQAGFYTFDEKKILRFYAFLLNDSNEVAFGVKYDSLGKEIKTTRPEVVNVTARRINSDSIEVTILLYSINYIYSNLVVKLGSIKKEVGDLFYSEVFSNLVGKSLILPYPERAGNIYLYIEGTKLDVCKNERTAFKDSTQIPFIPLK